MLFVHLLLATAAPAAPAPTATIAPGVELPLVVIGTGSGQLGNVSDAVRLWLASSGGGVGIDTAADYGDETNIAAGIAASGKSRGEIFLETKIPCSSYAEAKTNIAKNLQDLQTKTVDLTLIHSTSSWGSKCDLVETWKALEEAMGAGQSRAIGVSHFKQENFETLVKGGATVVPALNQV
jgi:diketogulonate reductase-like aldo/keto reductase